MFELINSKITKNSIYSDIFYSVTFGVLSIIFGMLKFQIPGVEGAESNFIEIPFLISLFYIKNPVFIIVTSLFTLFSAQSTDVYVITYFMHMPSLFIIWFFINKYYNKITYLSNKIIFWFFLTIIYYYILLTPLMIILNPDIGLEVSHFVKQYLSFIDSLKFEMVTTAFITGLYLMQYETKKSLVKQKNNLEKTVFNRTEELSIKNSELNKSLLNEKENKSILEEAHTKLKITQSQMVESEKLASLGQFTAGVAHEINNPINFIGAGINSLEENLKEVLNVLEKYSHISASNVHDKLSEINAYKQDINFDHLLNFIQKNTSNIKNGVERTSEIINGLMVFSRTDQDKTSLVDIHKNIEATLVILNNQISDGNIEIVKNFGKTPMIECFPGKLSQMFINLLVNSLHAINVENNLEKGIITIATKVLNKNEIVISLKDNGSGMSSDIKSKIFEPFYTTKDVGKGTGLGLSICYSIIQKHNGKVSVKSSVGKGTEFEIVLPIEHLKSHK